MVNVNCVHCGEKVSEWARECPGCGRPVANPDAPANMSKPAWNQKNIDKYMKKKSMPLILTSIMTIILVVAVIYILLL